ASSIHANGTVPATGDVTAGLGSVVPLGGVLLCFPFPCARAGAASASAAIALAITTRTRASPVVFLVVRIRRRCVSGFEIRSRLMPRGLYGRLGVGRRLDVVNGLAQAVAIRAGHLRFQLRKRDVQVARDVERGNELALILEAVRRGGE